MPLRQIRLLLLALFAILIVLSGFGILRLKFDFGFDSFLPPEDSDLAYHRAFNEKFTRAESSATITFSNDKGIFDRAFLEKVDSFCTAAKQLPYVNKVHSLLEMDDYIYTPLMPLSIPSFDWRATDDLEEEGRRILADPRWVNRFVSADGKMLAAQITLKHLESDAEEAQFNEALIQLADGFDFPAWHAIGFPVVHYHMLKLQKQQFALYILLAMGMMLVCLSLMLRKFWGIVVSFFSVLIGLLIFFGLLGWMGQTLDLMSTLFPILLVIVGTSDVVHLMTKYVDELRAGKDKEEAIWNSLKEIGLATFMTAFVTAVGLISLFTSNMPPIRNFGLWAAIGVMLTFVVVLLLNSALISWFSAEQLVRGRSDERIFHKGLTRLEGFTRRRSRVILIGTVVVLVICGFYTSQISLNLMSDRDLPRNSRLLNDYQAIDKGMKGLDAVALAIEVQENHSLYELETQRELEKLENFVTQNPSYGAVHSPNVFFRIANRYFDGEGGYHLPKTEAESKRQRKAAIDKQLKAPLGFMLTEDGKIGKLFLNLPNIGSERVALLNDTMDAWIAQNIDSTIVKFRHTGHRYILDKNQMSLAMSMVESLIFDFLVVAICMGLMFRSLRLVLISLVPNIVPLAITAAIVGLMGWEMDPKVAIVFTVAFGIAVDDTIHFLARYYLEKKKGNDNDTAIRITYVETGKAMILTSVVLFFGFGTLVFSDFPPVRVIGVLLCATFAVAILADLLLLPIGLRMGNHSRKQPSFRPENAEGGRSGAIAKHSRMP
jgi:uncharacterized protein